MRNSEKGVILLRLQVVFSEEEFGLFVVGSDIVNSSKKRKN